MPLLDQAIVRFKLGELNPLRVGYFIGKKSKNRIMKFKIILD